MTQVALLLQICSMGWNSIFSLVMILRAVVTLRVNKGQNNVTGPIWDKPAHPQVIELSLEHADVHLNPGFRPTVGQSRCLSEVGSSALCPLLRNHQTNVII